MNKYLKELIELNSYDLEIEKLAPQEEAIKAPLKRLELKKDAVSKRLEKVKNEYKDVQLKKSKSELLINELNEKIKDIEVKVGKVKTEKELKALTLEQEIAKENIDDANESIAKFEKVIENKKEEIAELEKELDSINSEISLLEVELTEKLELIEEKKSLIYKNREELIAKMSPNIYKHYEKIKRWAGNTAISPVRKQACMGCHMKISDKVYSDVIKQEEIISCPHCGRILFIEPESE